MPDLGIVRNVSAGRLLAPAIQLTRRSLQLPQTPAMSQKLTLEDAQQSLTAHVAAKGLEINRKYGPRIGWAELLRILDDRACVRYPCEIVFDDGPLRDGEFAHPVARGDNPEDGYLMHVHPFFSVEPGLLPALVLYQIVLINYGDFAAPEDAETFGAAVLGLTPDDYYEKLCAASDAISEGPAMQAPQPGPADAGGGCGSGCGCGK